MPSRFSLVALGLVALIPFAGVAVAQAPGKLPHRPVPPAPALSAHDDGNGDEEEDNPYAVPSASVAPPPSAHAPRPAVPFEDGMLHLSGGKFDMGSTDKLAPPNERPMHAVTVASFWIDRTEVTVAAYRACAASHACARPARTSAACTYDLEDPELPVSCVHWQDADAYCRHVGKRLPREAEWEFAARGTHPYRYPWGGWGASCLFAATLLHDATGRSCTKSRPSRVGAHPLGASLWGVLDMSGNVEEWTADWYAENVAEGAAPRAGASHVLRGGGWLSAPSASRTTSRNWGSSMEAGANVGFRCAKN